MSHAILVVGATGIQGSGVIKALLSMNDRITVHALVRDPNSPASQAIANLSSKVKLFKGNFDDVPSIQAAADGCTCAFLNVTPVFTDMGGEARHAQNLVKACAATPSLKRVVYSSSAAMHIPLDDKVWTDYVPNNPNAWMSLYLRSKRACEDAVKATSKEDLPEGWAILRGCWFFTNFLPPHGTFMYPELEATQTITTALAPSSKASYLDPYDLSKLVAQLLLSKDSTWNAQWKGKCIPVAKQNLTIGDVVTKLNNALRDSGSKKQINLIYVPEDEAKERAAKGDMFLDSHLFSNKYLAPNNLEEIQGFGIDIDGMSSVDQFFERRRDELVAVVGGL